MDAQEKSQVETWQMPDRAYGLSEQEAKCRAEAGFSNADAEVKAKSISAIISENVFTLFNLLNFVLGFIVLLAGAYQNALFLIVVLFNLCLLYTSVLLEAAFHDNPDDAQFIIDHIYEIGQGVAKGILDYFDIEYVEDTPENQAMLIYQYNGVPV